MTCFTVNHNIESLEEIVNEVPIECTILRCINKGLRSLRGIEKLPQIIILSVLHNQIQSLEGICESNVIVLYISNNQIQSLEHLAESNVTELDISNNPCYKEFVDLGKSIENVRKKYWFPEIKEPSEEYS